MFPCQQKTYADHSLNLNQYRREGDNGLEKPMKEKELMGKKVKLKCAISRKVQTNILHFIMMGKDSNVVVLVVDLNSMLWAIF